MGHVAFRAHGDKLHERRVVEPQELVAAVELQEQELIEATRDEALLVEAAPERVIEWGTVKGVEVVQIPVAEPHRVDVRPGPVGTDYAREFDLVVQADDL